MLIAHNGAHVKKYNTDFAKCMTMQLLISYLLVIVAIKVKKPGAPGI